MRWLALVLVLEACTDPAVEMRFVQPANAAQWDTSCVTNIEVRAVGTHYPIDPTDFKSTMLQLPVGAPTFADIASVMRGKVTLDIPTSGLAGVSVMGWSTPPGFQQDPTQWYTTPELIFFAENPYSGQDLLEVDAIPNVSCAKQPVAIRLVDEFELAAAGSSSSCPTAMQFPSGSGTWTGTIVPRPFGAGLEFYGGLSGAAGSNSIVQYSTETQIGPRSCLAFVGIENSGTPGPGLDHNGAGTGCMIEGPSVCAGSNEREVPLTNYNAAGSADQTLRKSLPGIVFGSVWTNATPRTPIAGATVSADPKHAQVRYIDPHADGTFTVRADQSGTGPSGMFVLYADALISATIKGGGKTRVVVLGATEHDTGGAMIVLK